MSLFYNDPNDPHDISPLTPSEIKSLKHKNVLDNWFVFTETLKPGFDGLVFYPENILPYEKNIYEDAFINYLNKDNQEALAINICNLHRFTNQVGSPKPLIKQLLVYKIKSFSESDNFDSVIELSQSLKVPEKNYAGDDVLLINLANKLVDFCEKNHFPKDVMYNANILFFTGTPSESYLKAKFFNK